MSALETARGEEQAEPQGFIDQIRTKFTSNPYVPIKT